MTTDDFTTAADARARELWCMRDQRSAFTDGARWARDHLAAQEPTDAEVLACVLGELAYLQGYDLADDEDRAEILAWWNQMDEEVRDSRIATARAALTAARKARP